MVDDLIESAGPARRDTPLLHCLWIGAAVGGVGFMLPSGVHLFFTESGRQFVKEVVHRDGLHGLTHPDLGFMAVLAAFGAAAGTVVGAMVWYSLPAEYRSKWRLFLTRGLLGGGLFLLALLLPAMVWGGISGVETPVVGAGPGFGAALLAAVIVLVVGGIPACLTGFVIGGSIALFIGRR